MITKILLPKSILSLYFTALYFTFSMMALLSRPLNLLFRLFLPIVRGAPDVCGVQQVQADVRTQSLTERFLN